TIDPSFGKDDKGGTEFTWNADYSVTLRTANPEAGEVDVTSITAYVYSSQSGTRQAMVALYGHDVGNDRAGDLLADSDEENFAYLFDGWRTFANSDYASLPSGACWLALLNDDTLYLYTDNVGSNYWRSKDDFTYPTFGNPWGPQDWGRNVEVSIYANYTVEGGAEEFERGVSVTFNLVFNAETLASYGRTVTLSIALAFSADRLMQYLRDAGLTLTLAFNATGDVLGQYIRACSLVLSLAFSVGTVAVIAGSGTVAGLAFIFGVFGVFAFVLVMANH
ncbi:unnamed protein product, partial [marine sediment metagenome]